MSEREALLPTKRIFCNQCSLWRCANAQYHHADHLRSEISSRALATFQIIGKVRKQGEDIWIRCV